MALRKASAYSKRRVRPYTRKSKVKEKNYIKTVPQPKIIKFRMGDVEGFKQNKYPIIIKVLSKENVQIRDNAIEAIRQYLNRFLQKKIGKDFYFEIKTYPHNIIRENKMLTGAGADRMQTGMSLSFGKAAGRTALIKKGQTIFLVGVLNQKAESEARKMIRAVKAKLPCNVQIETTRIKS